MERVTASLLFLDVAGYSKLTDPQLRDYISMVLPDLSALLEKSRTEFIELNTWGDGIVIASMDPYRLAHIGLDLRDFFRNRTWADQHLPADLTARISLHSGVVYIGNDPIRKTRGIVGTQINLTARIEPITTPGQVWVTEQFLNLIDVSTDGTLAFDELGERPLAKMFGSAKLFRLRRKHEPPASVQEDQSHIPNNHVHHQQYNR